MMRPSVLYAALVVCPLALAAVPAVAIIDPTLQPSDLFERHHVVLGLRVTEIDDDERTVTLAVSRIHKGRFVPREIVLSLDNDDVAGAFFVLPQKGGVVVAFAGSRFRGRERHILFYAGGLGRWQVGMLKSLDEPSKWLWTEDLADNQMAGTFNGHEERLDEMMADLAAGRYFFPATSFDQFQDDQVIGRFDKSVRGVALYDLNGNGRLDIYACSAAGNRAYLQMAPMQFENRTDALGLAGIAGSSVSFADVNASGRPDLLADGAIYLQDAGGRFQASDLLPSSANQRVQASALVDVNGNGWPDVLISRDGGGLALYLNPGLAGGPFRDATAAAGLDRAKSGAGRAGYFLCGDFSGNGRPDVFYAVGEGILLLQEKNGRFHAADAAPGYEFPTGMGATGPVGAGGFAPVWRHDRPDFVFSRQSGVNLLANRDGTPFEASGFGNELSVATLDCLAVVVEDLSANGNVDIYAGSRSDSPGGYYANRGYGSFMVSHRYRRNLFPGDAHRRGTWGVAVGDVDGDGANDLLLGGVDGTVTLVLNDALSLRTDKEHPTYHEQVLLQTGIVTVHVRGRLGVAGAAIRLEDANGRLVALRHLAQNINVGSCGPNTVNLAVRLPGEYRLVVRYSDGAERSQPVTVQPGKHAVAEVRREVQPTSANTGE